MLLKIVNGDWQARPLKPAIGPTRLSRARPAWTLSIAGILLLDGVTNGAVYALLALATVLVFAVTRVIFIPQGEFVAFGALTLALLQLGRVPGTIWLLLGLAAVAALIDVADAARRGLPAAAIAKALVRTLAAPVLVAALTVWAAPRQLPPARCRAR